MGRLVRDNRKATVTKITPRYNQGMQVYQNTLALPLSLFVADLCYIFIYIIK